MICRMCDEPIRWEEREWVHISDGEWHCPKHPAAVATPDDGSR